MESWIWKFNGAADANLLPGRRIHRAVLYFILGRRLRRRLSDAF